MKEERFLPSFMRGRTVVGERAREKKQTPNAKKSSVFKKAMYFSEGRRKKLPFSKISERGGRNEKS